jgi:DNA-directed RNA polymerase specialized sigma24 family protein
MPPKPQPLPSRRQLDRAIKRVEREHARLLAARATLDVMREKRPRFSQDDVAAYLREHPGSTYSEIAAGLGAPAVNVGAHLTRGRKAGRFVNEGGKWSLTDQG